MASPQLSVIVTCFNLGRYLEETLQSIRAQSCQDFELCIVDDGSRDPMTLRLLDRLSADFQVVRTDNRGLSAARNMGVASTHAPYVCTVDADDILLPELFEKSLARLDANAVNGAAVVRRSIVAAAGGWDETMRDGCEDWDFWITVLEKGYRGEIIPEILFHYRQRPDSMSRVSFAHGGHSKIYRRLVDKHPETFRRHLADVVASRESAIANFRTWTDELETKWLLELRPAAARAADDLAAAERAQTRAAEERALRIAAEESAMVRQTLLTAQAHQRDLEAHVAGTEREIVELRNSLSWKVTKPLRTIGAWFLPRRHP
jgi:glycosyltransferase involved in cell wall biosynthesis